MSALVETLLTALVLSSLAALCLKLLPRTPPRVRFYVAAAALGAWLVPWGWIRIALPAATFGELPAAFPGVAAVAPATSSLDMATFAGYALAAASLFGLALLVGDWVALRRCLRRWRAASRPADDLRALLPAELAAVRASIRLVRDSDIAAASGCLLPTIWIGDRYSGVHRELALVHEMCHVHGRDPLWLSAVAVVRRAYWWNPLVAHLARQAVLMIESDCDHLSAMHFGKTRYVTELASLLLAGAEPAPRLAAAVHTANLDVQRLRLLGAPLRVRARDLGLLVAIGLVGGAAAMASVLEPASAMIGAEPASASLPATPAGNALGALLRGVNGRDVELLNQMLGAYTPQELVLPLPRNAGELRVVAVVRSEPLEIEYVVEDAASGARHVGGLEVVAGRREIKATRLQGPL